MAKYYSSTFGKISGKHGSAVAVIRKDGSTYIRMHVKPANPRTDKQQAHRAKFALSSKALVPFNPIFKKTMGITSGISIARSHAFKNAIVGEYPNYEVDYSEIMFSLGTIEKLHNVLFARNEGVMNIRWDYKDMFNCYHDDSVSLVVFNKNTKQVLNLEDVAMRSDKEVQIEIYDSWTNDELYLWAYVKSGDKYSNSIFVNEVMHSVDNEAVQEVDSETSLESVTIQSDLNKAVMNLIMMVFNLLNLFKQVVIGTSIMKHLNTLIYKSFSVSANIESRNVENVIKINLNSAFRSVFEELWGKYHKPFATTLKPILAPNSKSGHNCLLC